jgi:acyl-CoA synthetase (AMP-forming)/AMP-acid ligase II/alkylation response protein AidB-like acyl-CoA dehydrogenase/acyl carrier protein
LEVEAPSTIMRVLADRAAERPDALAYSIVRRDGGELCRLTYSDLQTRAEAVAAGLADRVAPGDRVLMLFSSPLEFLVGLLGVMGLAAVAVPAPPLDASRLKRTRPRIQAIIADCGPVCLLVDKATDTMLSQNASEFAALEAIPRFATETFQPEPGDRGFRALAPDDLAYLQYTSGSTGTPRGVMISHRNLLANLVYGQRLWRYEASSVAVNWMPYFHDYGLVEGLLQPLHSGIPSHQIPTIAFLRHPRLWLETISRHGGTHSAAPNFGYEYCIQRIAEAARRGLDLASWRVASVGAEIVRPETLERFAEAFAPHGFDASCFAPSYGLAEATLLASVASRPGLPRIIELDAQSLSGGRVMARAGRARGVRLTSCGRPGEGMSLVVVDPDTGHRCDDGQVGEIWLRGGSISEGYWRKPQDTADVFGGRLRGGGGETWLRTGDLGFVQHELYITGRRKELIIVRGTNHYPNDIENTVRAAHPALRTSDCAAFAIERDGSEQVVVAVELENRLLPSELQDVLAAIRQAVAEAHDLPLNAATIVRRGSLPKTSSGKVQRVLCRAQWLAGELAPIRAEFRLDTGKSLAPDSATRADTMIDWLRDYAVRRINPALMDERRMIPPNVILDFGNKGLLGVQAPLELGGAALQTRDLVRVLEQIGAIDLSLGVFTVLHNALGLRPILRSAPKALRDRLVPVLARGRELAAFALTEPGAGSNVRGLSSTAEAAGAGRWKLLGDKIWSGSSAWAGAINVFVRQTGDDGEPIGISGFVVREGSPGLVIGNEALTMGLRGTIQNSVHLRGVPVEAADMLGAPGEGLSVAQDAMMFTRLCLSALCLGAMKQLARVMLRYGERRYVSTGRLMHNAEFQLRLSRSVAAIHVVEALVRRTAEAVDAEDAEVEWLYVACKIIAPELLWQSSDDAMQLLGGRAYMENNAVSRIFRDCRSIRVFEGPTETLRHHLGARALGRPAEFLRVLRETLSAGDLASEFARLATSAAAPWDGAEPISDHPSLRRQRAALSRGDVAAWMLALACLRFDAAANATPAAAAACAWCRERVDMAVAAVINGGADERASLEAALLQTTIAGWDASIGGERANMAGGVELEMDRLLQVAIGADLLPEPVAVTRSTVAAVASTTSPSARSAELAGWIRNWLGLHLSVAPSEIDDRRPFASYGLESVNATSLALDLEEYLDHPVNATLLWDYPTITALTAHLGRQAVAALPAAVKAAGQLSAAERDLRLLIDEMDQFSND